MPEVDRSPTLRRCDFVVIGAGIAGASAAYELQARGETLLLEREPLPGHHTTGRSAAFLLESYGNPVVQRLTRAGRDFLENPPPDFADYPLVEPRPVLWIARPDQAQRLADAARRAQSAGAKLVEIDADEVRRLCPALRAGYAISGLVEPDARHIDVAGLLAAYLRGFRARGGALVSRFDVKSLCRSAEGWTVEGGDTAIHARVVVNAAGAWADEIGALAGAQPIGLRPLRRTAITFDPPAGTDIRNWPCVIDADENFYVKPEGGQLLASPCDETPSPPCDAEPDDLGVALAADRVQQATTLELRTIRRRWAGLRSFVADRGPVIGMDGDQPGFFWLAGQGGFGIMTSPAASRAAASLVADGRLPDEFVKLGLTAESFAPDRLNRGASRDRSPADAPRAC
jgi:D-arginine dehydrogenase